MDTGQFVDVTVISTTCVWIQVICGYWSVWLRHINKLLLYLDTGHLWIQVKRMASQGSDVNRPFVDKSHLLNIINDPLVS